MTEDEEHARLLRVLESEEQPGEITRKRRMSGTYLIAALIVAAVVIGAGLWVSR